MTTVLDFIDHMRKALVAAIGCASTIATMGAIPAPYDRYVALGVAIATAVLTYVIPNVEQAVRDNLPEDVAGIPASQLIAEHEAEQANAAPVEAAEAAEVPTPTEDTPQDAGADTAAMSIEDILSELSADTVEIPVQ